MKILLRNIIALSFCLLSYPSFASSWIQYHIPMSGGGYEEIVDQNSRSTSGKNMHVCPPGSVMSGIHVRDNEFLCLMKDRILDPGPIIFSHFDDHNTRRHNMRACPEGSAMVGIHVRDNVLKCAWLPWEYIFPTPWPDHAESSLRYPINYVSTPSSHAISNHRIYMHACPTGWAMTGIHVNNNRLLCQAIAPTYSWSWYNTYDQYVNSGFPPW